MSSFWRSGTDYDIESESRQLRKLGEPFLADYLESDSLNHQRPLVVDFGCWSGRHLQLLERVAERGGKSDFAKNRVIGIDEPFAEERIAQARRAYKGFEIFNSGIGSTGLPPSSIDVAISWRVLHNLTKPGEWTRALSEIRRVLKHDAPLIIAVRAVHDWMQQDAPVPLLYRTYSYGIDRDDLYFSEGACYAMFRFYGFEVPYRVERFSEEEVINGVRIKNDYWMVPLVCKKRHDPEAIFKELSSDGPTGPRDYKRPSKRLAAVYK